MIRINCSRIKKPLFIQELERICHFLDNYSGWKTVKTVSLGEFDVLPGESRLFGITEDLSKLTGEVWLRGKCSAWPKTNCGQIVVTKLPKNNS